MTFRKYEIRNAGLLLALLLCVLFFLSPETRRPHNDALRYTDYALNLAQYGVFGLTPEDGSRIIVPGNANAPLYPMFVAAIVSVDQELADSLDCARSDPLLEKACPQYYQSLVAAQYLIIWLTTLLLWLLVRLLFDHRGQAMLAVFCALLSMAYTTYAHRILTEILIFPSCISLQLGLLLYLRQRRKRWAALIGLALGLLTLIRPEYLYLSLAIAAISMGLLVIRKNAGAITAVMIGVITFSFTIGPWLWRNHQQFDDWSLTGGGYAETILAYRLSYNRMTTSEWGASFIYWLPDFGDDLARHILPRSSYQRLINQSEGSLFSTAETEILEPELARRPREEIVGYWLRTEILGNPVKHTMVSVALAWRGIFVRKYWGIIGFFAYSALLIQCLRQGRYQLLLISLPVWYMVAMYAAVSASVTRYNLPLVALYSMGWGWLVHGIIRNRWKPHWPAIIAR